MQRFTLKNIAGFTILEVSLFLAISGGLAVIALAGLAPRLRNVRFTQAVHTVESRTNSEILSASAGVNLRSNTQSCTRESWGGGQPLIATANSDNPGTVGASAQCVVNGKLAIFMENKVMYHSLVSLRTPTCTVGPTFDSLVSCAKPRIARGTQQPFEQSVQYQNNIKAKAATSGVITFPLGYGYIQDPNSTTKYYFFFNTADAVNGVGATQFIQSNNSTAALQEKSVCLQLDSRNAKLTFSSSNPRPKVEFEGCS